MIFLIFRLVQARREKINDRMKILQDLVPGCNKVSINTSPTLFSLSNTYHFVWKKISLVLSEFLFPCFFCSISYGNIINLNDFLVEFLDVPYIYLRTQTYGWPHFDFILIKIFYIYLEYLAPVFVIMTRLQLTFWII